MPINRRQLILNSAGLGAFIALGAESITAEDAAHATILTKTIPSTGEQLPVIGLGTNRWVAAGSKSAIDELRGTLLAFQRMGGRVIDTAPSYRTSEKALGHLITELGFADAFFLATKVDRNGREDGIARMQNSLEQLGTDSVDLMQVHNLRGAETQLQTLREWKERGTIRYMGATTSRTSQFAEMELLMKNYPLDFVQLNYSLRDREAEQRLLPIARDKGIAVMVNRPFAHGHLFSAFQNQALPQWATELGCQSWSQFFLKYVVSHPAVTCTIPGTTKEHHVVDNMGAGFGPQPDEQIRKRQEALFAAL
ncbi:MAG: aldo/keto reductase [Gammaproteobacteria bacterium]|jgi:aryl-alcohol dehydrogenase-like predicted oxidoreductase